MGHTAFSHFPLLASSLYLTHSLPHWHTHTHTHKAAAKLRHHPQIHIHLSTLRKALCFFAFGFIRFGWPACTDQLDHASESATGLTADRAEQSIVAAGLQNWNTTNTSLNHLTSPCRCQQCTNALMNTHTYTRIHIKEITIRKLRVNPWIPLSVKGKLMYYWFNLVWRLDSNWVPKCYIPLEAKEVNSVKWKRLLKNPVCTLSSWPALFIGKKRMDGFILTTCDTTVFIQSLTFQHPRTQCKHNKQRKDFSYTYFKGERE